VSEQAIYRWKKQYAGLESDQVRELIVVQEENMRLRRLVADLSLDKTILQDINSRRWAGPS
jgi:putative transposase